MFINVLKNLKKVVRTIIRYYHRYTLKADITDLIVIDSFFPHPLFVYRNVEFETYIQNFNSLVYTTGSDLVCVGEEKKIEKFINNYPFKSNIKVFNSERKIRAKLAVVIFLNNMFKYLPYLEKNKIPFIFTLYPGGGFKMYDKESDSKLKQIFNSPFFKKVITTQVVTKNYLLENQFCKNEEVEFIYGAPLNASTNELHKINEEKANFDVCFVAAKYTDRGIDKGYDIFVEVARRLSGLSDRFRFHVAGGFSKDDIDVSDLVNCFNFYGYLPVEELKLLYSKQDIIISPNRANVLSKGAFDGFPTASVIEAGLIGVVMFVTDELNQNIILTDSKNCVIINHDPDHIVSKVMELYLDKEKLKQLAQGGIDILTKVFSNDYQMIPRLKLIEKYLHN